MPDTIYMEDGTVVVNHRDTADECSERYRDIIAVFPWFNIDDHVAAAEPYTHEIFGEQTIRTCFRTTDAKTMLGRDVGTAHRVFCLDSATSYIAVTELYEDEQPEWCPDGAYVLSYTTHHQEFGKPAPAGFDSFNEYFMACRPDVVESLGLNTTDVNDDTLISFLVTTDGNVMAKRRYSNFVEGDGVLANWQGIYVFYCKKARRMDLARALFATGL